MLPNFLVVGAAKSGTTTLYEIFRRHEEIFVPPKKELNYFSIEYKYKSISDYMNNFRNYKGEKAVGEVSPSYFWVSGTAERIFYTIPDVKIIIMLRNPVDRFYSDFRYSQLFGYNLSGLDEDFYHNTPKNIIQYQLNSWANQKVMLKKGLYSFFLKEYLKYFPREKIFILFFEDLIKNYNALCLKIEEFLEVTLINIEMVKENMGGIPRFELLVKLAARKLFLKTLFAKLIGYKRAGELKNYILKKNKKKDKIPIDNQLKYFLQNFYEDDIKELEKILKVDLSKWIS